MLRNILEKILGATTGFDGMVKDWESALVLSWYVYSFTVDDHENMLCFRDADINVLKKKMHLVFFGSWKLGMLICECKYHLRETIPNWTLTMKYQHIIQSWVE